MIGENATAINIQFVHVFIKLTLPHPKYMDWKGKK